jgi:hypothetical protein
MGQTILTLKLVARIVFKARLDGTLNPALPEFVWERLEPKSGTNPIHRFESCIAGVCWYPVAAFDDSGHIRK